mmetsp:Transcript_110963/g.314732  ORF Transcript_110963/g.314732 Transcript_110963/m.314732 type:complete len:374 (+) Transcript_110963:872-1993(+)
MKSGGAERDEQDLEMRPDPLYDTLQMRRAGHLRRKGTAKIHRGIRGHRCGHPVLWGIVRPRPLAGPPVEEPVGSIQGPHGQRGHLVVQRVLRSRVQSGAAPPETAMTINCDCECSQARPIVVVCLPELFPNQVAPCPACAHQPPHDAVELLAIHGCIELDDRTACHPADSALEGFLPQPQLQDPAHELAQVPGIVVLIHAAHDLVRRRPLPHLRIRGGARRVLRRDRPCEADGLYPPAADDVVSEPGALVVDRSGLRGVVLLRMARQRLLQPAQAHQRLIHEPVRRDQPQQGQREHGHAEGPVLLLGPPEAGQHLHEHRRHHAARGAGEQEGQAPAFGARLQGHCGQCPELQEGTGAEGEPQAQDGVGEHGLP